MNTMRFHAARPAAVLILGLLGFGAQSAMAEQSGWSYEFTPYLFASALNGEAGTRGVVVDVDESFSDIWSNLDIGFMALFEARKGRWGMTFDGAYFKVEDQPTKSVTGPGGQVTITGAVDASFSVTVAQPTLWYRVVDSGTTVDVGGSLRYTRLSLDLDVRIETEPGIVFPGGGRRLSGSDSWVDAVVSARVIHPIAERWSLMAYGDIGGGGADLTYQLVGGVNWALSERFTVKAGYRYAYWDYEDGGNVWDIAASGAFLGLGIKF